MNTDVNNKIFTFRCYGLGNRFNITTTFQTDVFIRSNVYFKSLFYVRGTLTVRLALHGYLQATRLNFERRYWPLTIHLVYLRTPFHCVQPNTSESRNKRIFTIPKQPKRVQFCIKYKITQWVFVQPGNEPI